MSREELRLSVCEGKERLTAMIAKQLKVRYKERGRKVTAYKCQFCKAWHIGSANIIRPQR